MFFSEGNSYYENFPDGRVVCIDDEIPFEIPQSWEWARLKNIFSLQAGKNITSSEIKSSVDELFKYPCFGGNGLRGYVRLYNNKGIKPLIGRQGALCGNLNMSYGQFYATEHAVVVDSFGDEINVDWSYYFLTALNLNQYATATAQPGLAVSKIIECLIPVPPRSEQNRIVAKIRLLIPCLERFQYAQDKLDTLNEDINNRLKKSILQEAIQGHLTPQNPSDEPVSVLLYRIKEEKKRLLKDGKIKQRDLAESVIYKAEDNKYYEKTNGKTLEISEEIPFDLPESWCWCRLASIVHYRIGKTPARGETAFWEPGIIPWVSISDMKDYGTVVHTKESVSLKAISLLGQRSPRGTLLMSFKLTVGRTAVLDIDAYHNEAIISIWPFLDSNSLQPYLFYTLPVLANLGDSKDAIKGKTLNTSSINNLLIPLPPSEEQSRIVNRIKDLFRHL